MSRVTFPGKLLNETVSCSFDFLSRLSIGEAFTGTGCAAAVYSGADPSPSSILGTLSISGTKIVQVVTGGVLGVTYILTASVTTNLGQTLSLAGFICVIPDSE